MKPLKYSVLLLPSWKKLSSLFIITMVTWTSLYSQSASVSPTSISAGGTTVASWSGFSGNVNIELWAGSSYTGIDPQNNAPSSGTLNLVTSAHSVWQVRSDYRIKVILRSNTSVYVFSNYFAITASASVSPTTVVLGGTTTASWSNFASNVNVELWAGSSNTGVYIWANAPGVGSIGLNTGAHSVWQVRSDYRIRVVLRANTSLYVYSNYFAVTAQGTLSVTPSDGFSSSGNQGGPFSPSSKSYTLTNTGGSSLNWTASKGQTWTTLSSTSGTLSAGSSTTVTVSINSNANSLSPGSYSDNVSLTNTTNGNGSTSRSVSLTINALAGVLSVSPSDGLSSSGNQGGPFSPSSKTYTLTNTGGSSINWTASNSQSWTSLSSTSGTLSASQSTTVTVLINSNANSLASGAYSDNVNFYNTTNGNGNTSRSISLNIAALPGVLSVTPAEGLSSSGNQGGPFNPSTKDYTLTNTGGSSINWTATKSQSWISLSSAGSTLAAGASTIVTVSINSNANSLSVGSYSDNVNFSNTTNGNGNTTRSVNLSVGAIPGVLSVTPSEGLSSSGNQGGPFTPSTKDYTLTNTGGSSINWTASKGQLWTTLSSTNGTLSASQSTTVTVSINSNANSISPGSYYDNLSFTNTTNGNGNTSKTINLAVASPPPPAPTPTLPTNNGTVNTLRPTLQVQLLSGLNQYEFRVYQGATIVRTGTSGSNSWALDIDLQNGSTYSWDCRAHNSAGWGQYFSPRWTFEVNVSPNTTFKLKFPLKTLDEKKYESPYLFPITSIFDHSMNDGNYTNDLTDTVMNYRGEIGVKNNNNKCIDDKTTSFPNPNAMSFTAINNYTGYRSCAKKYLTYNGHPGYDYATSGKVYAVAGGVAYRGSDTWGTVYIVHNTEYRSFYLHLKNNSRIATNTPVVAGQEIGVASNTAPAQMGVHLHFQLERKINGIWRKVDPYPWIPLEEGKQDRYPYKNSNAGISVNLWEDDPSVYGLVASLNSMPGATKMVSQSFIGSIALNWIFETCSDSLAYFEIIRYKRDGTNQTIMYSTNTCPFFNYMDNNIEPNERYTYYIRAAFSNGTFSGTSAPSIISTDTSKITT